MKLRRRQLVEGKRGEKAGLVFRERLFKVKPRPCHESRLYWVGNSKCGALKQRNLRVTKTTLWNTVVAEKQKRVRWESMPSLYGRHRIGVYPPVTCVR